MNSNLRNTLRAADREKFKYGDKLKKKEEPKKKEDKKKEEEQKTSASSGSEKMVKSIKIET